MKILQVNKMYYPDIGGVETIVKQYAEFLNKYFDITVLTASPELRMKEKIEYINNVKIIRKPSWGTHFSMPISISLVWTLITSRNKYDIIHIHEPFPLASILGLFSKKSKYIITWHSDIVKQKFLKKIVVFFQDKLCNKADVILATSPNLINFSGILKKYEKKVTVLPLSIDLNLYNENVPKSHEQFILYFGRLSYYKGIDIILKAYDKSKAKVPLYIVGDGDKNIKTEVNDFIGKSSKKIVFINRFVSEEEKMYYLRNCSFLLFPSTQPSEAFGIIQLEAMAYSKPIINTSLPTGVPWVSLHRKTGITVAPNNVEQLVDAINELSSKDNSGYGLAAYERE